MGTSLLTLCSSSEARLNHQPPTSRRLSKMPVQRLTKRRSLPCVRHLRAKKFHELVSTGVAKLGSMGTGGGGAAAPVAAAKAEETADLKEEEPDEVDVDMCGMFGDDDEY